MKGQDLKPNKGKDLYILVDNCKFARFPIKTHIITENDRIDEVCEKYALPFLQKGDILFISEKIVAIMQGRAFPVQQIQPSRFAQVLSRFVYKSPYGIGLGSPVTMELAIQEAGILRILLGVFASGVTKLFGIKGIFYKVVGKNINAIDGPCDYTIPPYNKYAKLAPAQPNKVAAFLKSKLNNEVVIVDANDLGVNVLGKSSSSISDEFCKKVFQDNPIGQSLEQTPLCIVRKVD